jgi:hypothetical protein
MMYVLSEEEYRGLVDKRSTALRLEQQELQALCTKVADEMPVKWGWGANPDIAEPWGCILTRTREWYCDQCPVQAICPNPDKDWSK